METFLRYAKQCKKWFHTHTKHTLSALGKSLLSVTVNHRYDCFLMMIGEVLEVVVSSCAKGRVGSASHANLSVRGNSMTRLCTKSPKYSSGTPNTHTNSSYVASTLSYFAYF